MVLKTQKLRRILREQLEETSAKGHSGDSWQPLLYLVFSNMQPVLYFSTRDVCKAKWSKKKQNKKPPNESETREIYRDVIDKPIRRSWCDWMPSLNKFLCLLCSLVPKEVWGRLRVVSYRLNEVPFQENEWKLLCSQLLMTALFYF